ncbi:MAG TPA: SDR family NAD(P)-dependent oxidoreductase [Pyrinomonadaceae bacterium]|nr:SDR family NAD(P)-dependent oxidoreductase [Pyrinomonadaceae bacterium]
MPTPSVHAFAEKVALITNGTSPIGRAVALQLALQGAYVICSYTKASAGDKAVLDELKSLGTLANSFEFTDAKTLIDDVDNLFGRIDLLVNCLREDEDSISKIESMTEESLRLMKSRPKGLIVHVISENQTMHFAENLPTHFRQNCVVTKVKKEVIEHELFVSNNTDDIARVVLFFLSNESKALNRQVLFSD